MRDDLSNRIQSLGKRLSETTEFDKRKIDCSTRELQRIREIILPSARPPTRKKHISITLKNLSQRLEKVEKILEI